MARKLPESTGDFTENVLFGVKSMPISQSAGAAIGDCLLIGFLVELEGAIITYEGATFHELGTASEGGSKWIYGYAFATAAGAGTLLNINWTVSSTATYVSHRWKNIKEVLHPALKGGGAKSTTVKYAALPKPAGSELPGYDYILYNPDEELTTTIPTGFTRDGTPTTHGAFYRKYETEAEAAEGSFTQSKSEKYITARFLLVGEEEKSAHHWTLEVNDTAGSSDSIIHADKEHLNVSDSTSAITDVVTHVTAYHRTVSDTATASDEAAVVDHHGGTHYSKEVSDSATASDSVALKRTVKLLVSDSTTATDTVIEHDNKGRLSINDTVSASDEVAITHTEKSVNPRITEVRTVYPSDKIAVNGKTPQGAPFRWAEDEQFADNVMTNITLSDQMPGGWKQAQVTLARDPRHGFSDLVPYSDMYAYIPGGRRVWEGSQDVIPDVSGDQQSISPTGVGYQSMLEDAGAVSIGFIDSELGKWGDPSTAKRLKFPAYFYNANGQVAVAAPSLVNGVVVPEALVQSWAQIDTSPTAFDIAESDYDSEIELGEIILDFVAALGMGGAWRQYVTAQPNSEAYVNVLYNFASASQTDVALAIPAGCFNIAIQTYFPEAFTGEGKWEVLFRNIKVLGRHGLPIQGTWPNQGFYSIQMLPYLINNFTDLFAVEAEMDNDGYLIEQAWYTPPEPASTIVKDLVKYGDNDWFVYRGKQLDYKAPGTYGKRWRSTIKDMALNETGVDGQRLWKEIVVQWQDPGSGKTLTAGPPGSGAMIINSALEVTDPQHPAVLAKRIRRDKLVISNAITVTTAVELGVRFLEEAQLVDHSGSATLTGFVMDDRGIFYPVSCVKSGDYIMAADSRSNGYRKIINKNYTHRNRQCQIDLDAPATGLEALLERLNAVLISAGVST